MYEILKENVQENHVSIKKHIAIIIERKNIMNIQILCTRRTLSE